MKLIEGPLVFVASPITLDLRAVGAQPKPFLWKNIRIKKTKYGQKSAYSITSTSDGYMDNQREAFRVPVSQQAVVQSVLNR